MGFENGKLVRVVMKAEFLPKEQVNVFHYDLQDSTLNTDNDPQTLADTFRDTVIPAFRALYTSSWTILPVIVMQEKDPQNPNAVRSAWTSGSVSLGTRVGQSEALPLAMCGVATLRTDRVGRRARGRVFLGGTLFEADMSDGNWLTSIRSLWQAYLDAIPRQPDLATGTSDSVAHWSVYSRTQRAAAAEGYANKVISADAGAKVHWLRSRDD